MRNIFLFIRRYFVFLLFLVLQVFSLWMLFKYNRFHRAAFLGVATELTGTINSQVDKVDDYFHLREENKRVHRMNDSLLNLLRLNYNIPDTGIRVFVDSLRIDTVTEYRRYLSRDAKVVYNSVNAENNYLQLNRGANQGIKDNMAVINSDGGVVGVIINVSPNFSHVLSLLHTKSRVPAVLKKTNASGTIKWEAEDPRFLILEGISKDVNVKTGDTVLTSQYAYNYPPGYMIGRIAGVNINKATGFYELKVRSAVNFSSVQQVFVIENLQRSEQLELERDTEKKLEQEKGINLGDLLKYTFRLAIFILVQVYVLNKIPHLHRFIVPYLYYLFLLWLPFNMPRLTLLFVGFITGLSLDYFTFTPGLHTAACVLVAYVRPYIINLLITKEVTEFKYYEPSPRGMGWGPYIVYAFILTFLHHAYLITLQWLQFGTFLNLLIKIGATSAISMLLILTVELLFSRILKYRTNT